MDLNEAINIAEQMANHYQAFKKIQEVLDTARNLSNAIGTMKKEIDSLQSQIDKQKVAMMEVESTLADKKSEYSEKTSELEKEYQDKREGLELQFQVRSNEISKSIVALTNRLGILQAEYADKLKTLKGEEASLSERIEKLKKMASDLKQRLAGVAE